MCSRPNNVYCGSIEAVPDQSSVQTKHQTSKQESRTTKSYPSYFNISIYGRISKTIPSHTASKLLRLNLSQVTYLKHGTLSRSKLFFCNVIPRRHRIIWLQRYFFQTLTKRSYATRSVIRSLEINEQEPMLVAQCCFEAIPHLLTTLLKVIF